MSRNLSALIAEAATPIHSIAEADLTDLMNRIGDSRVVLLGESSHGTSEFYRMRARITRALVEEKGFNIIAVEADWPDAAHLNAFVTGESSPQPTAKTTPEKSVFTRFPTWMWANAEVHEFISWLREHNLQHTPHGRDARADPRHESGTGSSTNPRSPPVGFYGLDLYSMYTSINAVLQYLDATDKAAAAEARDRYGCLTPWEKDPVVYGRAAITGIAPDCEKEVMQILSKLMEERIGRSKSGATDRDRNRHLDAIANARVVKNAEQYYRIMYRGSRASWNLRDQHMFDTLQLLMEHYDQRGNSNASGNSTASASGSNAKAVVWAHNSHIGDSAATEMGARGEYNIGHLCRRHYRDKAYLIGFGTHEGTVAAATDWDGPMEIKDVRPSLAESYERCCHESGIDNFMLPLRGELRPVILNLLPSRLERAIGVIYRPATELHSHYFEASLPRQFDEYIWFNETQAVQPLSRSSGRGEAELYPFGV